MRILEAMSTLKALTYDSWKKVNLRTPPVQCQIGPDSPQDGSHWGPEESCLQLLTLAESESKTGATPVSWVRTSLRQSPDWHLGAQKEI